MATRIISQPHLYHLDHGKTEDCRPRGTLVVPQLLLMALDQAALIGADRVVYPGSFDGRADAIARVAEQLELCRHLADLEWGSAEGGAEGGATEGGAVVEAPLLEMTDQQVVALGDQLGVPWHAAWSCLYRLDTPCQSCAACVRRKRAFAEAGVVDTQVTATAGV